jgi:hypothetical protein
MWGGRILLNLKNIRGDFGILKVLWCRSTYWVGVRCKNFHFHISLNKWAIKRAQ